MQKFPISILRCPEVAQYLGISESTLAKSRVRGDGPPYVKLGGKTVVYRIADLDAWIESRIRRSTSDNGAEI